MESQVFEAIVIGAGVMGSSAAYFLSKTLGPKVLLLEQFDRLHKRGSSHGESRIIRMTYPEDFNTFLMFDAYKYWNEIEAEAKTKLFTKTGGVFIGREDNSYVVSILKNLDTFKIPYSILTPETVSSKFPTVKLPEGSIAVYQKDAGVLNANKCVGTLQSLARENGCVFLDNSPVTNIKIEKDTTGAEIIRIESKDGRSFVGKKVIITSGSWTQKLVKNLGVDLPLKPMQATFAYWKVDSPNLYSASNFPVFMNYDDSGNGIYGTPALEYPNLIKCAGDGNSIRIDPDERDFQPDMNELEGKVRRFLQTHFIGVEKNPTFVDSCLYTLSPDLQFVVDYLPTNRNILIGCGFSGHGFKLGPVVGKILSDLAISGVHPYSKVHPHFTLQRF